MMRDEKNGRYIIFPQRKMELRGRDALGKKVEDDVGGRNIREIGRMENIVEGMEMKGKKGKGKKFK